MTTEHKRMRQLRATEAQWVNTNPTLLDGEIAYSSDVRLTKVGDGLSKWDDLNYWALDLPVGESFTGAAGDWAYDTDTSGAQIKWQGRAFLGDDINPNSTWLHVPHAGAVDGANIGWTASNSHVTIIKDSRIAATLASRTADLTPNDEGTYVGSYAMAVTLIGRQDHENPVTTNGQIWPREQTVYGEVQRTVDGSGNATFAEINGIQHFEIDSAYPRPYESRAEGSVYGVVLAGGGDAKVNPFGSDPDLALKIAWNHTNPLIGKWKTGILFGNTALRDVKSTDSWAFRSGPDNQQMAISLYANQTITWFNGSIAAPSTEGAAIGARPNGNLRLTSTGHIEVAAQSLILSSPDVDEDAGYEAAIVVSGPSGSNSTYIQYDGVTAGRIEPAGPDLILDGGENKTILTKEKADPLYAPKASPTAPYITTTTGDARYVRLSSDISDVYASPTGTGDGLTVGTPTSIQTALLMVKEAMATTQGVTYEVHMAAGTYTLGAADKETLYDGATRTQLWKFGDNTLRISGPDPSGNAYIPYVTVDGAVLDDAWFFQTHRAGAAFHIECSDVLFLNFTNKAPFYLMYGGGHVWLKNCPVSASDAGLVVARDCVARVNGAPAGTPTVMDGIADGNYAITLQNAYFRVGDDLDASGDLAGTGVIEFRSGVGVQASRGSIGYLRGCIANGVQTLLHVEKYARCRTQGNTGTLWTEVLITRDATGTWNDDTTKPDTFAGASTNTPVLGVNGSTPAPIGQSNDSDLINHRKYQGAQYLFTPPDASTLSLNVSAEASGGSADLGPLRLPKWFWFGPTAYAEIVYTLELVGTATRAVDFRCNYSSTTLVAISLPFKTAFDRVELTIRLFGTDSTKNQGYYTATAVYNNGTIEASQDDLPTFNSAFIRDTNGDVNKMDVWLDFEDEADEVRVVSMKASVNT